MIIGLTGKKRSGKDTAAQALVARGYTQLSFAAPLKAMIRALLAWADYTPTHIDRMVDGDLKEHVALEGKTARYLMQSLGTEWGREHVSPGIWVNLCIDKALRCQNAVISDVRFPNEAEAIRKAGGKIVKIFRRGTDASDSHPSEAIDLIQPDMAIYNNWSVKDLHEAIVRYIFSLGYETA